MCNHSNIQIYLLTVTLTVLLICADSASMPQNKAVLKGQSVALEVQTPTSNYVTWLEYITVPSGANIYEDGTLIYTGVDSIKTRYSFTRDSAGSTETHTLGISDVVLADGGRYGIIDVLNTLEGSAQVIVLDSDIECSVSPDPVDAGAVVTIICAIQYQGKWPPIMTCSSSDLLGASTTDLSAVNLAKITYTGSAPSGTSTFLVSCEAHFENPASAAEVAANEAINIPSYTSTWTGSVNIYGAATAISLSPGKSEFEVNDVITCLATGGNPAPSYEWYDLEKDTVMETRSDLRISNDMAGLSFNVRCTATTSYSGVDHELSDTLRFTVKKGGLSSTAIIIITLPTILGVLAAVAIALTIVFCLKKGKSRKQSRSSPDTTRKSTSTPPS